MRMSRQFEEQSIEAIDPLETMPPAKKVWSFFPGRYFKKYGRFKAGIFKSCYGRYLTGIDRCR